MSAQTLPIDGQWMRHSFKLPSLFQFGHQNHIGRTEKTVSIKPNLRYLDSSAIRVDRQGIERHPGLAKEESWCQTKAEGAKGGCCFQKEQELRPALRLMMSSEGK